MGGRERGHRYRHTCDSYEEVEYCIERQVKHRTPGGGTGSTISSIHKLVFQT